MFWAQTLSNAHLSWGKNVVPNIICVTGILNHNLHYQCYVVSIALYCNPVFCAWYCFNWTEINIIIYICICCGNQSCYFRGLFVRAMYKHLKRMSYFVLCYHNFLCHSSLSHHFICQNVFSFSKNLIISYFIESTLICTCHCRNSLYQRNQRQTKQICYMVNLK